MADTRRVWFLGAGQEDLEFDCVVSESHSSRVVITKNPVETGVDVADHAYRESREVRMRAEVSDTWLHARDKNGVPRTDRFESSHSRSQTAWQFLLNLQDTREPFDYQSGLMLYREYMLTELEADQDKMSAGKLAFSATLEEVIRVSTRTVTYPPRKPGKPHRQASKPVDNGQQATTPAAATAKDIQSLLLRGLPGGASFDPKKAADELAKSMGFTGL